MEVPYGSWKSPISGKLIAEGGVGMGWPQAVGDSLYWVEMRPLEGGRYVVVRRDADAQISDVTPPEHNARTLVHEYGGGMYRAFPATGGGESVVFSGYADQRLYRQDLAADGSWSEPWAITPRPSSARAWRYADGVVTPDGSTLVCVRERHEGDEVVNDIVALTTDGSGEPVVLAAGHDFYSSPRLSPDGLLLAWLSWDHPHMPWDGTELWVAELDPAEGLSNERLVAGGPQESVLQPLWSPAGILHFVSDRSGWWNIYRLDQPRGPNGPTAVAPIVLLDAEFAKPSWVFGLQNYGFVPDGRVVSFYTQDGVDHLALLDPEGPQELTIPYSVISGTIVMVGEDVGLVGASPTRTWEVAIVRPPVPETDPSLIEPPPGIDPAKSTIIEVVRRSRTDKLDPRYVSRPEPITFPTFYEPDTVTGALAAEIAELDEAATVGGGEVAGLDVTAAPPPALEAHALYFPPTNEDVTAPEGELPPLLVISHGGPTSSHETNLSMDIQFWTSRGFAVVDVNYGGSSGYGRAYRERLKGNWGIVDTVDCIRAAEYLLARGDVDPDRIAVRGGSAGGYTTLNALTRHRFFAAGASHFGLADLERFVSGGTHKFEERYLIQLIGPYPEAAELYRERSPINHVDEIACPVILLQGLDDAIVPPEQAEMIAAALGRKGLPYAYLPFEGEQHGFRKAENIVRSLEAELYFYGKVFGFTPADKIEPIDIKNLS